MIHVNHDGVNGGFTIFSDELLKLQLWYSRFSVSERVDRWHKITDSFSLSVQIRTDNTNRVVTSVEASSFAYKATLKEAYACNDKVTDSNYSMTTS